MTSLQRVQFVLHRPRSLDNVGAVARVVKNFGIGRLILVDPLSTNFAKAEKLAVGAEDVLEKMFVAKDLRSALGEMCYSAGTSSRQVRGRASLSPASLGDKIRAYAAPLAIVFGDEKRGLSDEEVALCQDLCVIPAEPAQPSLNLAQASAVIAHALYATDPVSEPERPLATQGELWAVQDQARTALGAAEFLNPQNPEHILRELMAPLTRAKLTPREAELWMNAWKKVAKTLSR